MLRSRLFAMHACRPGIYRICTSANQRTYKSEQNIENLFPHYKTESESVKTSLPKTSTGEEFTGVIPPDALNVTMLKSSGPGGQHVNSTHTKVQIRFNVHRAAWIPGKLKPYILAEAHTLISKEGDMIVSCDKSRSQTLNQADCLDKIRQIVFRAQTAEKGNVPPQEYLDVLKQREQKFKAKVLREKRHKSYIKTSQNNRTLDF